MPSKDIKKRRLASKRCYYKNRKKRIALSAKTRASIWIQNIKRLVEYLLSHPCIDCGETDPLVLDFDHIKGKKFRGVGMMVKDYSWLKILEEIAKCVVRCANCHRRKTAQQFGWKKILIVDEIKRRKTIG